MSLFDYMVGSSSDFFKASAASWVIIDAPEAPVMEEEIALLKLRCNWRRTSSGIYVVVPDGGDMSRRVAGRYSLKARSDLSLLCTSNRLMLF